MNSSSDLSTDQIPHSLCIGTIPLAVDGSDPGSASVFDSSHLENLQSDGIELLARKDGVDGMDLLSAGDGDENVIHLQIQQAADLDQPLNGKYAAELC